MRKSKTANKVFSKPVRELSRDEMVRVGGGYKDSSGPDNQVRNFGVTP